MVITQYAMVILDMQCADAFGHPLLCIQGTIMQEKTQMKPNNVT